MTVGTSSFFATALLPETAAPARLIVCERSGRWAIALRRQLAEAGVQVHQSRGLADCWELLREAPGSFLVVEVAPAETEGLLRRLARLHREFPLARLAVVADRAGAGCQWLLREAGAVHFTCSPRQLGPLAGVVCRHLAQVPAPPQTLSDRLWASLPWKP